MTLQRDDALAQGPGAAASGPAIKIRARDINVFYGPKQALFDVSLDMTEKSVTALIGPSGCGKSTFLRCINRMNDTIPGARVEGRIELDGEDVNDRGIDPVVLRARVGMVFQKPNPFPKTIYENVAYGPRIHGIASTKGELDAIVEKSLKRAGLWAEVSDRLQQPGTGLSGGQQQRLVIARAIAVSPEVILMDEPCSALDPIATARIEELIDELRNQYCIVIVTHSMAQAARVSQRTAFSIWANWWKLATQAIFSPIPETAVPRTISPVGSVKDAAMNEHIVKSYEDELNALTAECARMGGLTEAQVADSLDAVIKRDLTLAEQVVARDERLDILQADIERKAIRLIALRQPMANDLRRTVAAMKIANNLERCGDLAKNIAKRTMVLADVEPIATLTRSIERMGRLVSGRLKDVLDAYTASNLERALQVWSRDDEVDEHYNSLFRELLTYMMGDPRTITACAHLLFVAKNMERIGDHATNIAEIIHYEITGDEMMSVTRPKTDDLTP